MPCIWQMETAMACNGFNHRPGCDCNFKPGRRSALRCEAPDAPPATLLGTLAPPDWRPRTRAHKPRPCPRCGFPIYFVSGAKGGSYSAAADGSYRKHRCPRAVPTDRPRLGASVWRKEGFSATIKAKRRFGGNQRVEITGLAEGAPFLVEILDGVKIDVMAPAICRWSRAEPGILDIGYLDERSGDLGRTIIRARRLR